MSSFSYSAGELDRMENKLDILVQALVIFDAARFNVAAKFGFGPSTIEQARNALADFAEQLRRGLQGGQVALEYVTLLEDIRKGDRELPVEEWQEDLLTLPERLRAGEAISDRQTKDLQLAIGFFRQEVAERANRIRSR